MKTGAVILAAGAGRRMKSDVPKQFMNLDGEPMLLKSLRVFDKSPKIDEIILVTAEEYVEYARMEIVRKYGLHKVIRIVPGGKERYDSVYAGLEAMEDCDYVFIHDGARPYVTEEIIERAYDAVRKCNACVVGVPSKDTVKIADSEGFISQTPLRSRVWIIQTPQVFAYDLIKEAYEIMREHGMEGITDDAMVVEAAHLARVKLVEGAYSNIKITTPEDLHEGG